MNVLGTMQKKVFKKIHSWLLQDAHGLPHQLPAKAQVLTHHWSEQFKIFFLHFALHVIGSNFHAFKVSAASFYYHFFENLFFQNLRAMTKARGKARPPVYATAYAAAVFHLIPK